MVVTDGHLLGGRVLYRQPASGFRSGIEPVLLAAACPARSGERVLEAGTGAGAALLCLCARVGGILGVGVEIDESQAALAAANATANGFGTIAIIRGAIEDVAFVEPFDHAIANPPYHAPGGSTSVDAARELAKRGSPALIEQWVKGLSGSLRHRGTLTLIVPAGMVPHALAALAAWRCPGAIVFPLWPKIGVPAKLVLIRGIRHGRTPMRLVPGLILHRPDGSFTEAAQAIFNGETGLDLSV